tara:strand:- start:296 stop:523 length:228 start_codon:yes stop_codon:yes gene_type:complete
MDITELDFVLLMIVGYGLGVATGLSFCVKYRNAFLTRSKSFDNLNHQKDVIQPKWDSPVLASAPPPHNPVKLTIE